MTGAEIMTVVGFFLMVSGVGWGIWWKIDARVEKARAEQQAATGAAVAKADLALLKIHEHELHSAQIFATKAGMQEQTAQLLRAIESVGSRIDGLHERLDRAFERPAGRRAS